MTFSGFVSGQIVEKKASTFEAYYGMPDWWNSLFRSALGSGIYSINMSSQGPWGARYEYTFSSRVGVGVDIWYVKTSFSGIYRNNSSLTPQSNIYFNGHLTRINILPRMIFHFSKHEKIDPYAHVGLGFLYSRYQFESSNRRAFDETNPLPFVTFRMGMGVKYYLSPDFGGFVDVGLGGPLISAGVFIRWRK